MTFWSYISQSVVGLTLYVEEEDLTSWLNAASDNDTASRGNVSVSRKSATSVDVSFSSGMPCVNYYSITYKSLIMYTDNW